MTSSGTTNFFVNNGDVVIDAFERCQIYKPQLGANHFTTARRQLGLLLSSELSNRQINLWKIQLLSQALTQGTATYTLPSNVIMILDAYRSTTSGGVQTDIWMQPISLDDYASYPEKSTQAPPTVYYFNRQETPQVTMYPVPDSGGPYTWNFWCATQIQDANLASGETPDVPTRWLDTICAGLAYRLARIYAPALEVQRKKDYDEAWGIAANQDLQNIPVRVAPRMNGYWV